MTAAAVLAGDARWCVVEGDALDVLPTLPAAAVNALVTDPPAGISFMGLEFDHHKGGRAQWVAWLAQVLSLARAATVPSGRALVWALPRTAHWTGCAVEDAGWAIESKLYHLFGTGWPKGKSQLKPAAEEWLLARTGPSTPLNVDACRVGTDSTRRENRAPMGYMGNEPAADGYATGSASGRYPPNVLLSHGPGCVREGVRRVVAGDKGREWIAGRGGNTNACGSATVRPARGHGDPDGTETVEAWRCVGPTTLRVPLFCAGTLRPSGPSHEPEHLPGLLRYALRGWSACSTSGTSPSRNASASDDIARIRSVETSSAGAVVRALGLSGLRDFQDDYQFSLRSDDALAREVAAAFRVSPRRLFDVLWCVCSSLFAPAHSQTNPANGHQTSSGVSPASETTSSTSESRSAATHQRCEPSDETPDRTEDTDASAPPPSSPRYGTHENSTSVLLGTTETGSGIGRTESDEILLASWCLFVLSVASRETVAHQWIDINLAGCAVATLDAQAGERTSGVKTGGGYAHDGAFAAGRGGGLSADGTACYGDTGTASRFFPQFEADDPDEVFRYVAKPSRAEKNAGCEDLAQSDGAKVALGLASKVMRCAECSRTHPMTHAAPCVRCGGAVALDDAANDGSGRDGCATKANAHPTVKPVALMRWLIRLVTKPGDVVLDPFGGSGTTGVAALAEGRRVILVERDPRFAEIARARLQHAAPTRERLATMATAPVRVEAPDFGPLFGGARVTPPSPRGGAR